MESSPDPRGDGPQAAELYPRPFFALTGASYLKPYEYVIGALPASIHVLVKNVEFLIWAGEYLCAGRTRRSSVGRPAHKAHWQGLELPWAVSLGEVAEFRLCHEAAGEGTSQGYGLTGTTLLRI